MKLYEVKGRMGYEESWQDKILDELRAKYKEPWLFRGWNKPLAVANWAISTTKILINIDLVEIQFDTFQVFNKIW